MRSFEIGTDLAAPPDAVWQRVTTPQGINDELPPLMRMTMPRALRGVTIGDVAMGQRLCRSSYESFARAGENMTNAAMATYAFEQIERARAALA